MTPADRRITELIDKWLASIDLHLQYVELSDAAYARAQTWPRHDRPTRWVLEVARQKVLELKSHCENRQAMGDSRFSESLELMGFLANLVGIQHIQRFIPLADPGRTEAAPAASQTSEATTVIKPAVQRSRPAGDETTREMPRLKPQPKPAAATIEPPRRAEPAKAAQRAPSAPARASAAAPAAPVRASAAAPAPAPASATAPAAPVRAPAATAATRAPAAPSRPAPAAAKAPPSADLKARIIADAVRLLKWGKSWHELGELIARIADRPPAAEIRKVLRAHKAEIEGKAAG